MKYLVRSFFMLIITLGCNEKEKHLIISGNSGYGTPCDSVEVSQKTQNFEKDINGNYYYELLVSNRSKYELKNINIRFAIYKSSRSDMPLDFFTIHFDKLIPSEAEVKQKVYKADLDAPYALTTDYMVEEQPFNDLFSVNLDSVRLLLVGLHCWHEYEK